MASTKTYLPIASILPIARRLCSEFADTCIAIELAGSIRRQKESVGDIEVVAIPIRSMNLLGEVDDELQTPLDNRLRKWESANRIAVTKFGPKYKQFVIYVGGGNRISVDLFATTTKCFPVIMAIRTGPWEYSKAFVTPRSKGGLLQNGCQVQDCRLYQDGRVVDLRDERHFFEFVQGGYRLPEERCRWTLTAENAAPQRRSKK